MSIQLTPEQDRVAMSVAAYSDHVDDYIATYADAITDELNRFAEQLIPADHVILDAGCGPGRDLVRFAERGFCAVGVDLNPDFVAAAVHATDGWPVHVHEGDLRRLGFDTNSFDGTWASASLVHLDPDDAHIALSELNRVTRPGGPVYIAVKSHGTTGWTETRHGTRYFHIWEPDVFADAATNAGLIVESIDVSDAFVNLWATTR